MTIKMKARDLGLDDLRHDVEVDTSGMSGVLGRRVVGQLQSIEGPYLKTIGGYVYGVMMLRIGPAAATLDTHVLAASDVTVDRDPQRRSLGHFGTEA